MICTHTKTEATTALLLTPRSSSDIERSTELQGASSDLRVSWEEVEHGHVDSQTLIGGEPNEVDPLRQRHGNPKSNRLGSQFDLDQLLCC